MCMCVSACVGACVGACEDLCVFSCVCLRVWAHVCVAACVCVRACVWVRVCVCDASLDSSEGACVCVRVWAHVSEVVSYKYNRNTFHTANNTVLLALLLTFV